MVEKDFSKCQCPKAGWCDLLKKEMTATPPNWQWCQELTEEGRKQYHDRVNGEVRVVRKATGKHLVGTVNFVDDIPEPTSDYAVCVIPANEMAMNLLDATRENIKKYAEKCNADYIELTGDQVEEFPISNKFRLEKVAQTYEKTLFVDCDIVIKESAPNIFEITPNDKISAFDEYRVYLDHRTNNHLWIDDSMHRISKALNVAYRGKTMLNSGFMVIPKSCSQYYSQPKVPYPRLWCFDQMWLTLNTPIEKIYKLGREWNNVFDASDFWERFEESYVFHFNNMRDTESFHEDSRRHALATLAENTNISEFDLKTSSIWSDVFPKVEEYDLPENMDEVELVTVHFNPTGSETLRKTHSLFLEGLRNVAPFVKCYELLFDDQEQQIEGSIIIRGSLQKNCLWQKEALLNVAVKNIEDEKKYIVWLDHDLLFLNKEWLKVSISKMESGFDFVQLVTDLGWADRTGKVHIYKPSRLSVLRDLEPYSEWSDAFPKNPYGNPGLVWGGRVDALKRMGENPFPNAVIGSGDEYFALGVTRTTKGGVSLIVKMIDDLIAQPYLRATGVKSIEECPQIKKYAQFMTEKIIDMSKYLFSVTTVENCPVYHFWHGDSKHRQYAERHSIIQECNLDLYEDVFINDEGIYEFVKDKYVASERFYRFFSERKE
jgi:glycosyltransferase involved in cell wall biosynthesis